MLHTFIIWQSGFSRLSQLLWEISTEFHIKDAKKIVWDPSETHENLTKIYPNRDFSENSPKIKEIGGNELIMIVAMDRKHNLKDGVNTRVFEHKQKHRVGGINYLHASDHEEESLCNYMALTDGRQEDFMSLRNNPDLTVVRCAEKSCIVASPRKEFRTIADVFDLLNEHEQYVVLRNWEGLPETLTLGGHDDVDLLVRDRYRALALLNGQPVFEDPTRVHYLVRIDDDLIPFDIRFVK